MCHPIVIFSIAVAMRGDKDGKVEMCNRGIFEGCRSLLEEI